VLVIITLRYSCKEFLLNLTDLFIVTDKRSTEAMDKISGHYRQRLFCLFEAQRYLGA
jgi:hypothetical protein